MIKRNGPVTKATNFSLIREEEGPAMAQRYRRQREKRGFDDSETWNLDYTVACFLLPRLRRFIELIETHPGIPSTLDSFDQWKDILRKIEWSIKEIAEDEPESPEMPDKDDEEAMNFWRSEMERYENRVQDGLSLLGTWFQHLWW